MIVQTHTILTLSGTFGIPCSAEAIASVESILVGFAYITDVKEPAEPKNG